MFTNGITLVSIESNDEEFFIKCREIRDKIAELMGIHNPDDFAEIDNYGNEFIMLEIEKSTSIIREKK